MIRNPWIFSTALLLLIFLGTSCDEKSAEDYLSETSIDLAIPSQFSKPDIPTDNLPTQERIELGRALFLDPILSIDSSVSCATCHKAELAFADDVAISEGVDGRLGLRNAPSLFNVAWLGLIFKDGGVPHLDRQAIVPIEDENEMGFNMSALLDRLRVHPEYPQMARVAYGRELDAWVVNRALANFQRSLISGSSAFDAYEAGQGDLSEQAKLGKAIFDVHCSSCHSGPHFSNLEFENNGLYEQYTDVGRQRISQAASDAGKFRVAPLRNVGITAPYMHDGSLADLEAVIEHYNSGGENHPNKNESLEPLGLNAEEKAALLAFLKTLTESSLVTE